MWKTIRDFPNYEVSETGQVRIKETQVIRKNQIQHTGYEAILLSKDGRRKLCSIHRLVAEAFLENPDNLPVVNHKDENKLNNHVDNLEWCTHKYNVHYSNSQQRASESRKLKIICIELNKIYDSCKDAALELKVPRSSICHVLKGKRNHTHGYHFSYLHS